LLPNIPKGKDVVLKGVMTASSASSRTVADRYGFEFCTGQEDDILNNDEINTVFIATRHDTHGYYVKKALEAGKNVFVEKPLCLTIQELEEIKAAYQPTVITGWVQQAIFALDAGHQREDHNWAYVNDLPGQRRRYSC